MININELKAGDSVFSISMGEGKITSITSGGATIVHHGVPWKYKARAELLIRSGCNFSDLVYTKDDILLNPTRHNVLIENSMSKIKEVLEDLINGI